jgi:superfamily II DNA or RNA helicase
MSIKTNISSLTKETRANILSDLQIVFENKNKSIQVFLLDIIDNTKTIYIPYSYAYSKLKLKPISSKTFNFINKDTKLTTTLRDYQQDIEKQVCNYLKTNGVCLCSLHVGWGKSVLAISTAIKSKLQTLIIVNRIILAKQWGDLINSITNSSFQIVNAKTKIEHHDFYIVNIQNISKLSLDFRNKLGFVICDEIHLLISPKNITQLLSISPRYLLGLSATPFRNDELNCVIKYFFGENTITENLKKQHYVYPVHTNLQIEYELDWRGKINWNSLLTNQADNIERNNMIINIIKHFSNRVFLILVKRISQGKYLYEKLVEQNENVCNLLTSKSELDVNCRILIATTQKCGVGFSFDKLDSLLIASDMENYFIQYLGRVFRRRDIEPIIFDLVDNNPVLQKHFNTRKKIYKEVGGKIEHVVKLADLLNKY